ncbi:MAG: hypothetical protein KGZ81_12190 [Flavobacteriales bacterium]|nr:hypothetical protein [Flavobacteriales bacterium]
MKRILLILTMAINAFFCVMVHGQTVPTEQPQRVQHPYYQYDGFIEAKKGILLPRRIANFTPKSPVLIYDTVSGKVSVYFGGWKSFQNVAYTSDYNDLINRPDLTQYVPTSRTINGYSLTSNITINKVDIGLGNVQNVDVTNAGNITSGTLSDARLSANVTLQGNTFNGANQLLQLDAGGKVAYANLPASLMIYKGVWDASTNTPTLADGSGVNGWVYRVHPGGTVNFGSGNITFLSGDYVIYNGSVWQKSAGGDAVTSVNGQQGVVVLTTANIAEGGTNYYYTNTRVQTFGDTRYSLLNHEHVYSDIANLSSYTGFDVRYKPISYVPAWSEITGKPSFATVAISGSYTDLSGTPTLGSLSALSSIGNTYITDVAWSKVTGAPSFLTTENDPVYTASSWYSTTNNASNWNTAYAWGNYANRTLTINGTTYDLSTNRSWSVGTVTGTGTSGNIPLWNNASDIGNSVMVQSGGAIYNYGRFHGHTGNTGTSYSNMQIEAYSSSGATGVAGYSFHIGGFTAQSLYLTASGNVTLSTGLNIQGAASISGSTSISGPANITGTIHANQAGANIRLYSDGTTANDGFVGVSGSNIYLTNWNGTRGVTIGADNAGFTHSVTAANLVNSKGFSALNKSSSSANDVVTVYAPTGASYSDDGSTGAIKIRLPFKAANPMWTMKVRIYNYSTHQTSEYLLGNYSYSDGGYNYSASFSGGSNASPLTVRFGNDGTYDCVWIGETNTVWTYPVISVVDYTAGFRSAGVFQAKDWNISIVTSFGTVAVATSPAIRFSDVYASSFNGSASGLTGTASSLTAGNSNGLGGYSVNLTSNGTTISNTLIGFESGVIKPFASGAVQSFLGLGSAAYTASSAYEVPLSFSTGLNRSGNTITNTGVTSLTGTSNQIAVSAATGSVTVSLTNNVVIPGTITSSASYESSDRRLKRALSGTRLIGQIESLQARLYVKDGRDEYGYYAQDALKIIPTAVKQRADGYYDLSYTQVFVVKIASLEKRVAELETLLKKIYGK